MNSQRLKELIQLMLQGNLDASREMAVYLRVRATQAATGNNAARDELDQAVYEVAYEMVEGKMRSRFPFLIGRHSAASVVNQAWLRLLGRTSQPVEDPKSLCLRISYLAEFALLDIVARQRWWDKRHHAQNEFADSGSGPLADSFGQLSDGGIQDPSGLAACNELLERAAKLADGPREVFRLRYYLGMTRIATAHQLGLTEHRVRVLWLEALQRLAGHDLLLHSL
jgi:DNA-directed RNA polymerase specialized sigma24 family protein